MKKEYTVEEFRGLTIISYEENGLRFSFPVDESNSDYQRYLRWLNGEEENEGGLK